MSDEKKFFESMESDILKANIPEEEKSKLMKNLLNLKKQKINLMIDQSVHFAQIIATWGLAAAIM